MARWSQYGNSRPFRGTPEHVPQNICARGPDFLHGSVRSRAKYEYTDATCRSHDRVIQPYTGAVRQNVSTVLHTE